MNEMKQLVDELVAGMRERLPAVLDIDSNGIWSVCICGSYVRGDFVGGNSDVDFNIIFKPGRANATFPIYNANDEPGYTAILDLGDSILGGRKFHSHHPNQFDWVTLLWEWIPKNVDDIRLPDGNANFRYFNIFMFDYIENLLVLWGNDPRKIMPDPPDIRAMAIEWFERNRVKHERMIRQGYEGMIPFSAFNSICVAQIVFGERTLDKRKLLELYETHVPDFPMKSFGRRMITDKMNQCYPEQPCHFAPHSDYVTFDKQLGEIVRAAL